MEKGVKDLQRKDMNYKIGTVMNIRSANTFSIITCLYNKEHSIRYFLSSLLNQTYNGSFEIILVNDKSTDNSLAIAKEFQEKAKEKNIDIIISENEVQSGNCISRNNGIALAKNSILIINDCDCIMKSDYISQIESAFYNNDCDVLLGPINIETEGKDPQELLKDITPIIDMYDSPQDKLNRTSFLNVVTRNFTISKKLVKGNLFDPNFSYNGADPNSGYGWEDIELGYRLFKSNARIKYIKDIPTVHMSHVPVITNIKTLPIKSLKNFRRLHEKHPDMFLLTKSWSTSTYDKIKEWAKVLNVKLDNSNKDLKFLENHFKDNIPYKFALRKQNKLKILTFRWHIAHQYELYKLPYEFTLMKGLKCYFTDAWGYDSRPFPRNARMLEKHAIKYEDYDLAIIHFDENVIHNENTNKFLNPTWGAAFNFFIENVPLPKIGICHGTPQFYGAFNADYNNLNKYQVIEESRKDLVNLVQDFPVICNSYQALKEWGFIKSKCIWHGFDPIEFTPALYNKKILALINMKKRPHYRGQETLLSVVHKLPKEFLPEDLTVPEPQGFIQKIGNVYAQQKFRNYVDTIRQYSIYFNPTLRSPMPRSRDEAFMCGLATVTTDNHDANLFIKNGVNGFYSNDTNELADNLLFLCKNPEAAQRIGKEGRKTACELFHIDRYLWEWQETIKEVIGQC